ncbi:LysR substrate-binding domain-containing protein [Salinisphaera sp.]|uniref:LysR substrate-binding domain-containing protein n=1 Tax=Salinisphaera sp. TaxID=1914330 RepID=UPI002D772BB4|nr:LysR substrate-binding domain-containing protein [Salinisphaera sp.]HET7313428.1 LysR substrate-binding domain-containing protein [Salinisphaera sp.]
MHSSRFTLRQLDIFAAVMQTGRVRGAADRLHLSQAAVSQALQELADGLQVRLFTRRGRALVPTPDAQRLLALAHGPCAELAGLAERLRGDEARELAGPIHIAASSTIARYLLPAPLARLAADHPALRPTLTSGNSAAIEQRIAKGDADLGFIEGPARRDDIQTRRWRTDRLEIIGPPDAPTELTSDTLNDWRWVMREAGSGTQTVFEHSLALAGIPVPRATLTVDDSGAQVRAVAAGAGLACVSRAAADTAARNGGVRFMHLAGHVFARPLWAIRRADDTDTPLIARVLAALNPV